MWSRRGLHLDDWLNLIGLTPGLGGTWYTASSPILSKKEAVELGVARWAVEDEAENLKLPLVRSSLEQSRRSKIGLGLIAGE